MIKLDDSLYGFYADGFKIILALLCALVLIFLCYGRCSCQEQEEIINFAPAPVTQAELRKMTDIYYYEESSEDTSSED